MRLMRYLLAKNPNQNVPNQRLGAQLWQDPIFGYFETHGKMEFKPGEEYDISEKQKGEVMERYLKKERLKREFIALQYNPQRYKYIEGVIMDPALFRWYATDMSHTERFRLTPKTIFVFVASVFMVFWLFNRYAVNPKMALEERCRAGEVLWWDRSQRWYTQSGEGHCSTGQA